MLAKTRRLRAVEVREVLAHGRSRRGKVLSSKILTTTTPFRAAVVVSKKVAKTAVLRNRVRRAVYAALGHTSLPRTGHAILFVQSVPKADLATVFSSDLKQLLNV